MKKDTLKARAQSAKSARAINDMVGAAQISACLSLLRLALARVAVSTNKGPECSSSRSSQNYPVTVHVKTCILNKLMRTADVVRSSGCWPRSTARPVLCYMCWICQPVPQPSWRFSHGC